MIAFVYEVGSSKLGSRFCMTAMAASIWLGEPSKSVGLFSRSLPAPQSVTYVRGSAGTTDY